MEVIVGAVFESQAARKRGWGGRVRRLFIEGLLCCAVFAAMSPVSMARGQSRYLESIDLLYRNFSMVTAFAEDRLAGDFMTTVMRLEAGELERHDVAGAWASEAAGAPEGEANGVYAASFAAGIEMDTAPIGYETDATGGAAGYERWLGNTLYGLNLASTKTEVDFSGSGFEGEREEQEMLSGGIHAVGTYYDDWTWRGRIAGFLTRHEGNGVAGEGPKGPKTTEYDSTGINASATIGRMFRLGGRWGVVLPEIGGEYLYTQRERFTIEAATADGIVTIDHLSDNRITGLASLGWTARAHLLGIDMVPSVSAGLRLLLTEEMIGEGRTVGGSSTRFEKELEKVTRTFSASLRLHLTKHLQAAISYDSGFGEEATEQLLAFRCRFSF